MKGGMPKGLRFALRRGRMRITEGMMLMNKYYFSEKNENSLCLAADIEASGGECFFFDSIEEALEKCGEEGEKAVLFIKENEAENLTDVLKFNKAIKQINGEDDECGSDISGSGIMMYVFTSSDAARTVLDSVDTGVNGLRLIDPIETAVWNLMKDHPIYETRDRLNDEELRVLIIGEGDGITSIVKTVYWCGRMRLFRLKMNMIGGKMQHLETEMKLRCPGLFTQTMQENLDMRERGLVIPELYLPLKLTRAHYYQAATDTEEFEIALNECLDSNYIIIDEGDDDKTLQTAMAVRAHFIRKHVLHENFLTGGRVDVVKLPDIFVRIKNDDIAEIVPFLAVEGHPADRGNDELAFVPFGNRSSVYSAASVIDTEVEKLAEALFEKEFTEENCADGRYISRNMPPSIRRMLKASALHLKYKLRDLNMIARGDSPEIYNEERFPELRDITMRRAKEIQQNFKFEMTACEHQAWVVFRLSDGWIPADAYHSLGYGRLFENGQREHRQFAGKMSSACVESSALSGTGSKMYGNPSYFTEYNRETAVKTCSALKAVYPEMEFAELIEMDFDD